MTYRVTRFVVVDFHLLNGDRKRSSSADGGDCKRRTVIDCPTSFGLEDLKRHKSASSVHDHVKLNPQWRMLL